MGLMSEIFSWWGGNTWGTRLWLARHAELVGTDDFGNRYYEQRWKKGSTGPLDRPRRWVTYKSASDPTTVSADWHGWLHYSVDTPPTEEAYRPHPWQKPHTPNMTGTREAHRPQGSILASGQRPRATGDYKPWRPE